MVKNNKKFVKKTFLSLKYQKLLTFLVKNQKKNCHVFLGAFIWNHPATMVATEHQQQGLKIGKTT